MKVEFSPTFWINREGWAEYEAEMQRLHLESMTRMLYSTKKVSDLMSSKSKKK